MVTDTWHREPTAEVMHRPYPPFHRNLLSQTTSDLMDCLASSLQLTSDAFPMDAILQHNKRVLESAKQAIRETNELIQRQRYAKMRQNATAMITSARPREKVDKSTSCDDVMPFNRPKENLSLPNITKFFEPVEQHIHQSPTSIDHRQRDTTRMNDRRESPTYHYHYDELLGSLNHRREHLKSPTLPYGNVGKYLHDHDPPHHLVNRQIIREANNRHVADSREIYRHVSAATSDDKETDSCSSNGIASPRLAPQLVSPAGSNDTIGQKIDTYPSTYDKINDSASRPRKQLSNGSAATDDYIHYSPAMKENFGLNEQDRHVMNHEHFDWRREKIYQTQKAFDQTLQQQPADRRHPSMFSPLVPKFQQNQRSTPSMYVPPPNTDESLIFSRDHSRPQSQPKASIDHSSKTGGKPPSPSDDVVVAKDGKKRGYLCHTCGKVYCRKYVLKIHQRVHSGEKPLVCKICSKCFSDPSNMKKHLKLHESDHVSYTCEYCRRHFATWKGKVSHVANIHHKGPETES